VGVYIYCKYVTCPIGLPFAAAFTPLCSAQKTLRSASMSDPLGASTTQTHLHIYVYSYVYATILNVCYLPNWMALRCSFDPPMLGAENPSIRQRERTARREAWVVEGSLAAVHVAADGCPKLGTVRASSFLCALRTDTEQNVLDIYVYLYVYMCA